MTNNLLLCHLMLLHFVISNELLCFSVRAQNERGQNTRHYSPPVTSGLTVTPLSTKKCSGTVEEVCGIETCGLDTCVSVECGSTHERRSPAGSSRPGSAKLVHTGAHVAPGHMETTTTPKSAIHTRPRTIAAHSKPAAQSTLGSTEAPTDGIYRSTSKGNKPASDHKPTGTQQYNVSNSPSGRTSVTRQKERRAEREMDREKDKRSRTEGQKETGREKQEMDKERWMSRTRKKQQDKEKEMKGDSTRCKNQAAVVIQRAWRRYWCFFLPLFLYYNKYLILIDQSQHFKLKYFCIMTVCLATVPGN